MITKPKYYSKNSKFVKFLTTVFLIFSLIFFSSSIASANDTSSYNEGIEFGKEYKDKVIQNIEVMKNEAKLKNLSWSIIYENVDKTEKLYKEILPEKLDWIKGVSDSTDIPYKDLLLFNAFDKNIVGFEGECTTMLAQGKALKDGKGTMIMKNRDQGATALCEVTVQAASTHPSNGIYEAAYIDIPQISKTYKFVGNRTAGRWGLGMGINEHQVIVANNDAPSRDYLDFEAGLHDNDMIRLILERAKTAREGVEIATKLVEKYGQAWNGIMFEIGDPNELWVVEVTGHRWAAKKYVDTVSARSNQYQIEDDYDLCSSDLVSFSIKQGWVDKNAKKINFKKVYNVLEGYPEDNDLNKRTPIEKMYTTEMRYQRALSIMKNNFGKITMDTMMTASRDHYDTYTLPSGKVVNTNQIPFYSTEYAQWEDHEFVKLFPKEDIVKSNLYIRGVCSHDLDWGRTVSSGLLVARPNVPNELGLMLHTFSPPCNSVYVPFYVGIDKVHSDFESPKAASLFQQIDTRTFGFYSLYHDAISSKFAPYEKATLKELPEIEQQYIEISKKNTKKASDLLNNYIMDKCTDALILANEVQDEITRIAVNKNSWIPRKTIEIYINGKSIDLPNKNLLLDEKSPSYIQTKFIFESMGYKFNVNKNPNGQTIININK
ncbi:MAG: C69 family dipeptidase [Clostridiaceae bacterium]